MHALAPIRFLFFINPRSGSYDQQMVQRIEAYFKTLEHTIKIFELPMQCSSLMIEAQIASFIPDRVIAVGGDGTIHLIAGCLINTHMLLGILPAGSANGLAKDLRLSKIFEETMEMLIGCKHKKIHVININGHHCIHLSDIGINAYALESFNQRGLHGLWKYIKAGISILWKSRYFNIVIQLNNTTKKLKVKMLVMANGNSYGTGAVINPIGKLDDELFEVIAIKKIALREVFKMVFTHEPYNNEKTAVYQTNELTIHSSRKVHFQVDGEYLGKVKEIKAYLIPSALSLLVPA
jgi:diacylglycerol kinase family enzyme